MGRAPRVDVGGEVYHVINRGNFQSVLFRSAVDYDDFMGIVGEAMSVAPMRILAYCLMPNHWHMVLHTERDGDLSRFLHWVTLTHTQRYHGKTKTRGYGHIYQGRYKSFPVQNDRHFLTLVRYVERNAKRAALVARAEDWRWSSAHARTFGGAAGRKLLSRWPTAEPAGYLEWLNKPQPKEEVEGIRYNVRRGKPYGSERWTSEMVRRFGLEATVRDPWRPQKGT